MNAISKILDGRSLTEFCRDEIAAEWNARYDEREWVRSHLTDFLLWSLRRVNRYKDRCLARRLHNIADEYDPRPTGEWQ